MYNYKIVMNGQGGLFFCSMIKEHILDYWLHKRSLELLQEYVLAQYLEDQQIEQDWRIPEEYRFNIFNNLNSLCLWQTDSIIISNSTICDIYKLKHEIVEPFFFSSENDFSEETLIDSFLCSERYLVQNERYDWEEVVSSSLRRQNLQTAYLIYFKANARGYATHEGILRLGKIINKKNLKFYIGNFGNNNLKDNVLKKAYYNYGNLEEQVLYDFRMLKSAREKNDFDFTGIEKVNLENTKLYFNWIES